MFSIFVLFMKGLLGDMQERTMHLLSALQFKYELFTMPTVYTLRMQIFQHIHSRLYYKNAFIAEVSH